MKNLLLIGDSIRLGYDKSVRKTLEGKAVSLADRIAYINHDIDDAIVGGFITTEDLPSSAIKVLGKSSRERINTMLQSIANCSDQKNKVEMEKDVADATTELREFLFKEVYANKVFRDEETRADRMITALYEYYMKSPENLPEFYFKRLDIEDVDTVLCDYISGMSDVYVVNTFNEIFIPKNWKL